MNNNISGLLNNMSMIIPSEAEIMLSYLEKLSRNPVILDIGTGMGHSSAFFALTRSDATVFTIDGYGLFGTSNNIYNKDEIFDINKEAIKRNFKLWESHSIENIVQIFGDSKSIHWINHVDFIFIDADHSFEGVKNDFYKYDKFNSGVTIFHDYNNNFGVKDFISTLDLSNYDVEIKDMLAIVSSK